MNYIQSFSDLSLAAAAAETMLDEGADVLTGTAQMVPGAIGKAQEAGALWFGTQADQTSLAPDVVVANQVYDWTVVLDEMIAKIQEGQMGGEAFAITLENGGELITFNEDYELPEDVLAAAEDAIDQIASGAITFSVDEEGMLNVEMGEPMMEATEAAS